MKKSIIAFVTVLIIFYLVGSFVAASFDIKQWHVTLRAFIGFSALVLAIIGFRLAYTLTSEK